MATDDVTNTGYLFKGPSEEDIRAEFSSLPTLFDYWQRGVNRVGNWLGFDFNLDYDKPSDLTQDLFNSSRTLVDNAIDIAKQNSQSSYPSGYALSPDFDYGGAKLAEQYGMSRETAYNEMMNNTAYQRAVADMKAAGLNPAVLFSSGSAAGSTGAVGRAGSGSRSSDSKDGFLDSDFFMAAMQLLGSIVGAYATKSVSGAWAGKDIAGSAAKAVQGIF